MVERITPLILTLDEAPNIARTLARLTWADDVVVVDSGSTDGTLEILARYPRVRVFNRPFTTHAEQWNFGLHETEIRTEWVLALDADFVLSEPMLAELDAFEADAGVAGYQASFTYCIEGNPLRGAVYPPVVVLFRREDAAYVQDGHTQRITLNGRIGHLKSGIYHDDRKPLARWLSSQAKYMQLENEKLLAASFGDLGFADKMRRMIVLAPVAVFVYCLIVRGGLLDGKAGFFYAFQRATAEAILSLYLLQAQLGIKSR